MEKIQKDVNNFPFLWNNFHKFIRESEEELGKISHFSGKVDFIIRVGVKIWNEEMKNDRYFEISKLRILK